MPTFAQNMLPSFLRRHPSSSNIPVSLATFSSWAGGLGQRRRRIRLEKCWPMISSARYSLEAFGPGVPGENVALRIQHEDRVVAHAFDQQPKPLLALSQYFGVRAMRG